jgi:hypothetical protein
VGDTLVFDVGLSAMSKNNGHSMVKNLACLAILVGFVWLIYPTIFSSPLSGELSHDFGVVPIDRPFSVLEHTFRLKNTTDHTMQLTNATPTCGCTTTDWPDDPVPSGEELVIPTHLKLRRSQLRSSAIRLEFASGEVVVLNIRGVGRFKQPMSFTPQKLELVQGDEDGVRGVLKLEWFDKSKPPEPTVETPEGVRVEFDRWRMTKAANPNKGTPQNWTMILSVFQEAELKGDIALRVSIKGAPVLQIPCTTESTNPEESQRE